MGLSKRQMAKKHFSQMIQRENNSDFLSTARPLGAQTMYSNVDKFSSLVCLRDIDMYTVITFALALRNASIPTQIQLTFLRKNVARLKTISPDHNLVQGVCLYMSYFPSL